MLRFLLIVMAFLTFSCTEDENNLVKVSLSGIELTFISNDRNNEPPIDKLINYSGTQILRFENQSEENEVFEFEHSYEELLRFETELPQGKYDVSFEVESDPYSEFLPFHFSEENIRIEGNDVEVKVNPLTNYSLVQLDTAFVQTTDIIPFISSVEFGQQDLLLNPDADLYYLYVTTGQGGMDIEVSFQERTFGEHKKLKLFIKPKTSYALGLSKDDGLSEGPSIDRFKRVIKGSKHPSVGYWEYLPAGYGYGKKWPLILSFHGRGQNGSGSEEDLGKLIVQGLPRLIGTNQWPVEGSAVGDEFIVLSMQYSGNDCPPPNTIRAAIRWSAKQYDVDIQRIYLTGLSCGAIGIWNYVRDYLNDDLVSAVVPIAGFGESAWERHGCNMGKLPIWAFHGELDDVVSPDGTNIPIDSLAGCMDPEPVDARKTIYTGVRHLGWNITYDLSAGHDIYAWMLSHVNEDARLD